MILVGAFVIGPATEAMHDGEGGRETVLIGAAAWDVLALTLATTLSVFKPRGTLRSGSSSRAFRAT